MIQQQSTYQFLDNLESVLSWIYLKAFEEGKNPEKFEEDFKIELYLISHKDSLILAS